MTITANDAFQSSLESLIKYDKLLSIMPNVTLAFYILYMKLNIDKNDQAKTKWTPYLNILPSEFHNPLYFTLDELKVLQPAQTFSNSKKSLTQISENDFI